MSRAHTPCQANCGRPAGSGFVCDHCWRDFLAALEELPDVLAELENVLTRQTVYGARYGSRPTDTPLPFDERASRQSAALRDLQATFADTPHDHLRVHPDSGQMVLDLCNAVERAWWLVDRPPDRWYAGPCHCGRHLYATHSTGAFQCDHCKAIFDAGERRSWMLSEAEDHLADASTAARAVTFLGQVEITPHRIYTWVQRGRLVAKGHELYATTEDPNRTRPLYRLGDILDLAVDTIRSKS